jgi:ectoine hydroxylase-related dioxygenase (phytanoyl-CoA dioxygenase family)
MKEAYDRDGVVIVRDVLEPMEVATVWFAATRSTRENGCVQVIPGSHHQGMLTHLSSKDRPGRLSLETDPAMLDESKAVHVELEAGDVSVHHPLVLHASDANKSDEWRRGGSIQVHAADNPRHGRKLAVPFSVSRRARGRHQPLPGSTEVPRR